jgi:hypothetical protein
MNLPKIIHQIWIGPDPIPKEYQHYINMMRDMHPDWQHIIWGNKEIFEGEFKEDPFLSKWKDQINSEYLLQPAFISDRARLLILEKMGGIYVDVDAKPIKSFNTILPILPEQCKLFAGWKWSGEHGYMADVTALGAIPDNPHLKFIIGRWGDGKYNHPLSGLHISNEILDRMDYDITLLHNDYFYSGHIKDRTLFLHDTDHRALSWTAMTPEWMLDQESDVEEDI